MNTSSEKNNQGQLIIKASASFEELSKYLERGAENLSKDVKVKGFRPGKVPMDVLRREVGDVFILEEAARLLIAKEADAIVDKESVGLSVIGRPNISITKLAWDNDLEFNIEADLLPEIKLADYKNLPVKMTVKEIGQADIDKVVEEIRESRAKEVLVEREIVDNDKVVVDILMFVDEVPVDGGQSKGIAIVMGKNYIVPGFDKELLGAKTGDEREFTLPFPEDYHQRNLAGKRVEFKVTIKSVFERQLPEANDELAKSFEAENLEALHKMIKENMEHQEYHRAEEKAELEMFEKLIADSEFGVIPESLKNSELQLMMAELKRNVEMYGGKFDDYLLHIKKSAEELKQDFAPDAEKRVKSAIIMRRLIETEKVEISDDEVRAEVSNLLAQYGNDPKAAAHIKSVDYQREIKGQLAVRKMVENLKEWNIEGHQAGHQH